MEWWRGAGCGEEEQRSDCSRLRSEWVVRTQRQDVDCSFKHLEMLHYKKKVVRIKGEKVEVVRWKKGVYKMGGVEICLYAKERLRSDKLGEHTGWDGDNWWSVEDPSGAPRELVLLLKGHLVHYGNIREWVVGVKEVNMHVVRKDGEDTLM